MLNLHSRFEILAYGVIGNTSVFGAEEYRFETYWANKKSLPFWKTFFIYLIYSYFKGDYRPIRMIN